MALATTTVALIGLAVTAASTGAALYAQDTAAKQQSANEQFAADQAAADAKAAQGAAQVEADRIRKAAKKQKAAAIAAAAASGVDVGSESALKINEGIDQVAGEDAYLTLVGGTDAAARLNQQAAASRIGASSARSAGRSQQIGTLLSAAGTAATSYGKNWKRAS
ncbi:hypothetical protein [Xanthomonas sacchari]|uniref:hypothetical protein n=1 Tax=Xanthomonas sacchari TaxID=56458 RepID=UPI002252A513|nr:hypothetical protein [Xanthomonas sacchari]MCW0370270.1 hypothetical protein [Xanthomonas sacchari]